MIFLFLRLFCLNKADTKLRSITYTETVVYLCKGAIDPGPSRLFWLNSRHLNIVWMCGLLVCFVCDLFA